MFVSMRMGIFLTLLCILSIFQMYFLFGFDETKHGFVGNFGSFHGGV